MLDFNDVCAIIDLVCNVGRLGADVAYLPDKCELCGNVAVDLELGIWMRVVRMEDLFYRNRSDCIFAIASFACSWTALNFAADEATTICRALCTISCAVVIVVTVI